MTVGDKREALLSHKPERSLNFWQLSGGPLFLMQHYSYIHWKLNKLKFHGLFSQSFLIHMTAWTNCISHSVSSRRTIFNGAHRLTYQQEQAFFFLFYFHILSIMVCYKILNIVSLVLYRKTLFFIHPIYNSLYLHPKPSPSPPCPSSLSGAMTSLFSMFVSLFLLHR